MDSTTVPLSYVFSSKVVESQQFNCEIYETVFRIPLKILCSPDTSPPKCAPCVGPWLDPEWLAWVHNHPAFNANPTVKSSGIYSYRQGLLREVIWPAFASYIMRRSEARNLFIKMDMLGILNWYREVLGCPKQQIIEPDSQYSDGLWWFMIADSPWAIHPAFDDLLYDRQCDAPGPDTTLSAHGIDFAPNCCTRFRTAFWDMKFPMEPGLEGTALERLCMVMRDDSTRQDWASQQFHWQFPQLKYIWIKYWGPRAYSGGLKDLVAEREKWLKSLREAF